MAKVYLLLGGNLGDRNYYIQKSEQLIVSELGSIITKSSIYETEPWGFKHKQNFYNRVVLINTKFNPHELLKKIHTIENNLGRGRGSRQYSSRTVDIDILFYDDMILNEKDLIIPHSQLHNRRFVLKPMCEIKPEFLHPLMNVTVSELLSICKDNLIVNKIGSEAPNNKF
ncbi:MAG: 2-amino-4-hydroxy-6-hydroxymethyldihydropteridine diphosphokinase [Bacteroidales bacterium]|nr:2-amino-4-hydroxy-6-hydroxymethyldihydropteridine diphosphokinase [Bacteroidales bacterium]